MPVLRRYPFPESNAKCGNQELIAKLLGTNKPRGDLRRVKAKQRPRKYYGAPSWCGLTASSVPAKLLPVPCLTSGEQIYQRRVSVAIISGPVPLIVSCESRGRTNN